MKTVFQKLQLKYQNPILILNHPETFNKQISMLDDIKIDVEIKSTNYDFILVFVVEELQVEKSIKDLISVLKEDATLWFAYPKKSSKKYKATIFRDEGWKSLGNLGYEGVSLIAIDEDWSALRFRKINLIKSFKRNPKMALSKEGKNRTAKN
jgi:hypothetical protein